MVSLFGGKFAGEASLLRGKFVRDEFVRGEFVRGEIVRGKFARGRVDWHACTCNELPYDQ